MNKVVHLSIQDLVFKAEPSALSLYHQLIGWSYDRGTGNSSLK